MYYVYLMKFLALYNRYNSDTIYTLSRFGNVLITNIPFIEINTFL